jgi:hypothetical protein
LWVRWWTFGFLRQGVSVFVYVQYLDMNFYSWNFEWRIYRKWNLTPGSQKLPGHFNKTTLIKYLKINQLLPWYYSVFMLYMFHW